MTAKKKRDYTIIPTPEQHTRVVTAEFVVPVDEYEDVMREFECFMQYAQQYGACEILRNDLISNTCHEAMEILSIKVKQA